MNIKKKHFLAPLDENASISPLFSNADLRKLFFPLIIEQFLEYLVGLADSIMVAHVGEAAVSGVSLVDFVMQLFINLFVALATGGSVIAGQYLGHKDTENAKKSANQLVYFACAFSLVMMAFIYLLKAPLFSLLFGQIEADVYFHANLYFLIVVASIPFLALYNAGASLFRTVGNSKLPMKVMLCMNIVNVIGNYICVFVFGMGTEGIALPTLLSRIGAAVIVIGLATKETFMLRISLKSHYHFDRKMIRKILGIGAPYALENGMIHIGRIMVLSLVSTFGTAAIAANSISGTIVNFEILPGVAIGYGMTVVISRCVGLNDYKQARYYTKKIIGIMYCSLLFCSAVIILLLPLILNVYGLSIQATKMAQQVIWTHTVVMCLIWPLAFAFPAVFRSAGDAKFPMFVNGVSMFVCRIGLAYVICAITNLGMFGTWVATFIDWIVKSILFTIHYFRGKWQQFRSI